MPERKPIFYDEQRRRWRRTRRVLELAGGFFTVVLVIFVVNLIRNPRFARYSSRRYARHSPRHPRPPEGQVRSPPAESTKSHNSAKFLRIMIRCAPHSTSAWDSNSLASLQSHYHDIDLLLPEALHAVSPDGHLDIDQDPKLLNWLQSIKPPRASNSPPCPWSTTTMARIGRLMKWRKCCPARQHEKSLRKRSWRSLTPTMNPALSSISKKFPRKPGDFQHFIHEARLCLSTQPT